MNNLSYSYSRLQEYSQCPFKFKSRVIDKVPFEVSPVLSCGSAVHDCLRDYALECYKAKTTQLFSDWEKICLKALKKHPLSPSDEVTVLEAVKEYVEANQIELDGLAGVEEEVALSKTFKPCKWDTAFFRGIIDKLYIRNDVCKISDYKTGFDMSPNPFQLEVYAWMVSKLYPEMEYFQVELDFTRFSVKKSWDILKKDIPAIERKIMSKIEAIEEDEKFEPRVSSKCEFCPYWRRCPAVKKGHEVVGCTTDKSAIELMKSIVTLQKVLSERKEILKDFVNTSGKKIFLEDLVAEFRKTTTVSWDAPSLLIWARENNVNVIDALSFDNRKLARCGSPLPADLKKEKVSSRFFVGKAKSEEGE